MPVSTRTLCRYAAFLARSLCPSSIKQYLNCIRLLHLEYGLRNPLKDNWPLYLVLRGIEKTLGRPPRQKLPITPRILIAIHDQLDLSCPLHMVFWAACLLGFFSFCRKATLVPKSTKDNYRDALCRDDVRFVPAGVILNIRKTKTIQCGQRVLEVPLAAQANSPLCPVAALKAVWAAASVPPQGPLFSYRQDGSVHALDYKTFSSLLTRFLQGSGLDNQLYSGHSLRRGGATYAFQCGVPPAYIKAQGDWASSCWERYIHMPLTLRWKLAASMTMA